MANASARGADGLTLRVRLPLCARYGRRMGITTYNPNRSKYTFEVVSSAVKDSVSYMQVLSKLGLRCTGSGNSRVREMVRVLGIDTSHFLGGRTNSGPGRKGGNTKLPWEVILVRDRFGDGRKEKTDQLRRAMKESGIKEICRECGLGPVWRQRKLSLQIDHVDGDCINNTPSNVRFLCPNCHSQTPTFGSGNFKHRNGGFRKKKTGGKRRVWKDGKRITVYEARMAETADAAPSSSVASMA